MQPTQEQLERIDRILSGKIQDARSASPGVQDVARKLRHAILPSIEQRAVNCDADTTQNERRASYSVGDKPPSALRDFALMVERELVSARTQHPQAVNSLHEGYAVIAEEVDELWDQVRARAEDRSTFSILSELVQIGAMAQRVAEDVLRLHMPADTGAVPPPADTAAESMQLQLARELVAVSDAHAHTHEMYIQACGNTEASSWEGAPAGWQFPYRVLVKALGRNLAPGETKEQAVQRLRMWLEGTAEKP